MRTVKQIQGGASGRNRQQWKKNKNKFRYNWSGVKRQKVDLMYVNYLFLMGSLHIV